MKLILPPFVRKALARQREEERLEEFTRRMKRSGFRREHTRYFKTRLDGSPFTKPSIADRRQARRRRNRAASVARKENR